MEITGNITVEGFIAVVSIASAAVGIIVGYIIARLEKI